MRRNGGQMGALCNIQIDPKIKSVDISLYQCKKTILRKSNQNHALWQNGRPDQSKNQKCWYFVRPKQKNDSPKSMHPDNFGLTCTCQMEVPPELLQNHWFYNFTRATLKVAQMRADFPKHSNSFFITLVCLSAKERIYGPRAVTS